MSCKMYYPMIKLQTDHGFHKFNSTDTVVCFEKDGTLNNGYMQFFLAY